MSSDINFAVVSGNVVRDPELRSTAQGQSVMAFTVASNDEWGTQAGTASRTNFVACELFGRRADALSSIVRKGMPVTVSGRLRTDSWEKDGQRRTKTILAVGDVKLPPKPQGGRGDGGGQAPRGEVYDAPGEVQAAISAAFSQQGRARSDAYMAGAQAGHGGMVYDEEIPF